MADNRRHSSAALEAGAANEFGDKMIDPKIGGQHGALPKIGGVEGGTRFMELHSSVKHTNSQIIPVVLQTPRGFKALGDSTDTHGTEQDWINLTKAIFEEQGETITGLKGALTVNSAQSAVGGAGEQLDQVVNVVRERSEVAYTFKDLRGLPIQRFHTTWIEQLLMDPDAKHPKISLIDKYATDVFTPDYYTMTMIFIEMDYSSRYVERAWLVSNMYPTSNGTVEGRRNLSEDASITEHSITYTGVTMQNRSAVEIATSIMESSAYTKKNYNRAITPVTGKQAELLKSDKNDYGYTNSTPVTTPDTTPVGKK